MTGKKAEIFLYQERINPAEKYNFVSSIGMQLVLDDVIEIESHFLPTGLRLDRDRVRELGEEIGKRLYEEGITDYQLRICEKYNGEPCMDFHHSDIWALERTLDESIRGYIGL